jgi:hypothetical protein
MALGPAIFNHSVPTLDVASFTQALAERADKVRSVVWRCGIDIANHREVCFCASGERLQDRDPAEHDEEIAAVHSMTSSDERAVEFCAIRGPVKRLNRSLPWEASGDDPRGQLVA